ncbi:MAG: hypothetical protein H0W47_16430 [Polaromonas sp.]|nr:hypothetical protein [Polaromonas sp.]
MVEDDETRFLDFLRGHADIRIFQSFADSSDALLMDAFAPRGRGQHSYLIWNVAFPWTPTFKQSQTGEWYVSNSGVAPLVQYTRHRFATEDRLSYGRLYWAKTFAAPDGVDYDLDAFDKWFTQIASWVRRHGKKKAGDLHGMYFLPEAFTTQTDGPG